MITQLGQSEIDDIGTVRFQMFEYSFEIKTPKQVIRVPEKYIKEVDGKYIFQVPGGALSATNRVPEIEIPAYVIEAKNRYQAEYEQIQASIGHTETTRGKVFFSLTNSGEILCSTGNKTETVDHIYNIEGKRAVYVPGLGLENSFLEVPEKVEAAQKDFQRREAYQKLHMVYAGRSLLTGIDYYDFSADVSRETWNRVKSIFEYFGEGGDAGLEGWLTSEPEKVEEWLRIRKNLISERREEIEQQKVTFLKAQAAAVKKLTS